MCELRCYSIWSIYIIQYYTVYLSKSKQTGHIVIRGFVIMQSEFFGPSLILNTHRQKPSCSDSNNWKNLYSATFQNSIWQSDPPSLDAVYQSRPSFCVGTMNQGLYSICKSKMRDVVKSDNGFHLITYCSEFHASMVWFENVTSRQSRHFLLQ